MGVIHIATFATLDLVGQAPGGPDEDPDGFAYGGWQAPLVDEISGAQVQAAYEGTDALLLGRRTFDIFAAYWPDQTGDFARLFNRIPKYVASRSTPDLSWEGSTHLGPDLAAEVRAIRERHDHVTVVGSLDLLQTLLSEGLFDRIDLWLHPVVLGAGKKVFTDAVTPGRVRLVGSPEVSPGGIVYLRYARVDGAPETGDMTRLDGDPT
ncbi:dihydrofolate reductase family protein [Williamsia herbipolensis]|uniref:dihydrofolate reductase family protein n=1 Tax=Williamsia herbipolensis TaxID=1603258 RepID=UPI0005F8638F|nr:dihydrofolate reductase family protein [Williamsia herbipolensis]